MGGPYSRDLDALQPACDLIQSFALLVRLFGETVEEARLFSTVQEIGERLQARTGITFPRSRWPIS